MASVVVCPHCYLQLSVPDELDHAARVKCPACRDQFDLQEVEPRALPEVVLAESSPAEATVALPVPSADAVSPGEDASAPSDILPLPVGEDRDEKDPPNYETPLPYQVAEEAYPVADEESLETTPSQTAPPQTESAQPETAERPPTIVGPTFDLPDVPLSKGYSSTIDLAGKLPSGSAANTDFEMDQVDIDRSSLPPAGQQTVGGTADQTVAFDSPAAKAPPAEYEPAAAIPEKVEPTEQPTEQPAELTAVLPVIPTVGRRRTRRLSKVAMLLGFIIFSVGGLSAGYYGLLVFLGPRGDFLGVAQYLPTATLPESFAAAPAAVAQADDATPIRSVDSETTQPRTNSALAGDPPHATANFEQPIELTAAPPNEAPSDPLANDSAQSSYGRDDSSRSESSNNSYGARPARYEAPAAAEPAAAATTSDIAGLVNTPSFTTAQLAAAFEESKAALPGLVEGDLSDSKSRRRTKGLSYAKLCDLAHSLTFCDDRAATYSDSLIQASELLFRDALAAGHTRAEVAKIATIWINSPHRQHNGFFVAGSPSGGQIAGDVYEYRLELEHGETLAVISRQPLASRAAGSTSPVGIVGAIVDQPSQSVRGYDGNAPQAIWVGRVILLD